ncbi:hypothetical protein ABW19_dt0206670 [Dactylella cylindrospora]|nr:hypothetical protein ABW19_dt0206670 [Dactylella cylindrospora]
MLRFRLSGCMPNLTDILQRLRLRRRMAFLFLSLAFLSSRGGFLKKYLHLATRESGCYGVLESNFVHSGRYSILFVFLYLLFGAFYFLSNFAALLALHTVLDFSVPRLIPLCSAGFLFSFTFPFVFTQVGLELF